MNKVIVTLRGDPTLEVNVPDEVQTPPKEKGGKPGKKKLERTVHGAVRLFPQIPKAISQDELDFILKARPDAKNRLDKRKYVESKRVDLRGAGEKEIEELAEKEGLSHLPLPRQIQRLREKGKLKKPEKRPASKESAGSRKKNGNGKGKSGDGGK